MSDDTETLVSTYAPHTKSEMIECNKSVVQKPQFACKGPWRDAFFFLFVGGRASGNEIEGGGE